MEYEQIVANLEPITKATTASAIPLQTPNFDNYVNALDKLAIHLRSEFNRNLIRDAGLLSQLFRATVKILEGTFHQNGWNSDFLLLSSELLRCVANSLVDNDENRKLFIGGDTANGNVLLDRYVSKILLLVSNDKAVNELQTRALVVVRNFCLGNDAYVKRCPEKMLTSLVMFLKNRTPAIAEEDVSFGIQQALDLLADLVEQDATRISLEDIKFFVYLTNDIANLLQTQDDTERAEEGSQADDECDDLVDNIYNISKVLELALGRDEELDLSDANKRASLHGGLFSALETLHHKEFGNKMIVMRNLTSCIGYISANKKSNNMQERDMCYSLVKTAENGYIITGALFILSNSISNRKDTEDILKQLTLSQMLECTEKFKDPYQYQSFIDIFKKCLNIMSIMEFPKTEYKRLFGVVKLCSDQSKYYTALSPLVEALLNKILATCSSADLIEASDLSEVVVERSGVPACLLLSKLSKQRKQLPAQFLERLLKSVFTILDSVSSEASAPLEQWFHLTKAVGIYIHDSEKHEVKEMLARYGSQLALLLESGEQLREQDDAGSKSCWNNSKFIAGLLQKYIQEGTAEEQQQLEHLALTCRKGYLDC